MDLGDEGHAKTRLRVLMICLVIEKNERVKEEKSFKLIVYLLEIGQKFLILN